MNSPSSNVAERLQFIFTLCITLIPLLDYKKNKNDLGYDVKSTRLKFYMHIRR